MVCLATRLARRRPVGVDANHMALAPERVRSDLLLRACAIRGLGRTGVTTRNRALQRRAIEQRESALYMELLPAFREIEPADLLERVRWLVINRLYAGFKHGGGNYVYVCRPSACGEYLTFEITTLEFALAERNEDDYDDTIDFV